MWALTSSIVLMLASVEASNLMIELLITGLCVSRGDLSASR
jgi:hypothetical protein